VPQTAFSGFFPLTGVECGIAFGQSVSINGCVALMSFHAYVHSDSPRVNFLGPATVDVMVQKNASGVRVNLTIYTPKTAITVQGSFTGTVGMSTCP